MPKFKVHWGDRFGAVCGATGEGVGTVIAPHNLHQVTCRKCLKKMAATARALSGFADMIEGLMRPSTSIKG